MCAYSSLVPRKLVPLPTVQAGIAFTRNKKQVYKKQETRNKSENTTTVLNIYILYAREKARDTERAIPYAPY